MKDYSGFVETLTYLDGKLYKNGKRIGGLHKSTGYWRMKYKGQEYLEHRVVYFMFTGELPEVVDHIDLNKLNNHISNLRGSDNKLNQYNIEVNSMTNIRIRKSTGKFEVAFSGNHLGTYSTLEEAQEVRDAYRNSILKGE